MKYILYIAVIVSVITYSFWFYLPKGSFYIGNSLFIMLLCMYLFIQEKSSMIKFVLLSLAINNLLDELIFDNTKLGLNEILVGLSILVFAIIKRNNARQIQRNN